MKVPIEFVSYIVGHDIETIKQMYDDWLGAPKEKTEQGEYDINMRSVSEILSRLKEAEEKLANCQEWYKNAKESYDRNRRYYGSADYGEVQTALDAISEIRKEIEVLKWVLRLQK